MDLIYLIISNPQLIDPDLDHDHDPVLDLDIDHEIDPDINRDIDRDPDRALDPDHEIDHDLDPTTAAFISRPSGDHVAIPNSRK